MEECVTNVIVEGGSCFFAVGTGEEVVSKGVKLVGAVLAGGGRSQVGKDWEAELASEEESAERRWSE